MYRAVEPLSLPLGQPRAERGDAVRNRQVLLATAREMIAELGVEHVTMDGLAERAGLGKGTVYRRFGTRAGIFHALLDADEIAFQQRVLGGPPPLGPGADPVARLIAYGRARIEHLIEHIDIARAALDTHGPIPTGPPTMSPLHLRMLLDRADLGVTDTDTLALQLTGALEGPILLFLGTSGESPDSAAARLTTSWESLIERLCAAHR
ncbi:TetR/AcrR family transcriptional regulator [Nocardia asteroides NBRC 15531]|uniref:TetR family transcriptional regulator n=1 Tax=Nocardia asteroides NBRC 15531 TaxID=1110697 RepID=U5EI32_NOCAS|nr:TetR/AcrR family transcriptional regulator [Nocardia asteroides NBRC 15531]GAD86955.1 putative TetR family transcriptional regulator [Nocardia asteroides NBRC 15531]SFM72825.1 transcriptional regulator, TetR family [Nocardia asteroides]VEG33796.1 DNA-binding transcriptional regulator EnvR [Nocardia asteroides]